MLVPARPPALTESISSWAVKAPALTWTVAEASVVLSTSVIVRPGATITATGSQVVDVGVVLVSRDRKRRAVEIEAERVAGRAAGDRDSNEVHLIVVAAGGRAARIVVRRDTREEPDRDVVGSALVRP